MSSSKNKNLDRQKLFYIFKKNNTCVCEADKCRIHIFGMERECQHV